MNIYIYIYIYTITVQSLRKTTRRPRRLPRRMFGDLDRERRGRQRA